MTKNHKTALAVRPPPLAEHIARELARDPDLASTHTRKSYRLDLARFEGWRAGRLLTKLLVEEYVAELRTSGLSPLTINRRLSAIRWWARRAAERVFEDTALPRADRDELVLHAERVAGIDNIKGKRTARGRHVTEGELAALLSACGVDATAAGVRDAALIALAWASGARRGELAQLWIDETRMRKVGQLQLKLHGKGDKDRELELSGGAAFALSDWLRLRGPSEGYVFCAIYRSGRIQLDHGLSTQALADLLKKRRLQAGVAALTWHDFRRSFAGNLLDRNVDIATVQKLMGHASPTTTANYDRRPVEVQKKALGELHVPYTPRALLPPRKVKK